MRGGVLSPLFFNFALRKIARILPQGVRILQFADDILLYVRFSDINEAQAILEQAVERLTPCLSSLGFSLTPRKVSFVSLAVREKSS